MDAATEYLAQESLGVVLALICKDSDILIKYRGFLQFSLVQRILAASSDFCELSGSDGALLMVLGDLMCGLNAVF